MPCVVGILQKLVLKSLPSGFLCKACFLCVVLHSGAPDHPVENCVRPPISLLTQVGCVGLFLPDLLGSCLLLIRLAMLLVAPLPISVDGERKTVPADPLHKVKKNESCIGPTSEIIMLLCQCQGTGHSNCTLPNKPTVREVVLP